MSSITLRTAVAFGLIAHLSPLAATTYRLRGAGTVQMLQGNGAGASIKVGDAISAAFNFDDADAMGPTLLPLGGGVYSIYNAPISALSLTVGAYRVQEPLFNSTLTYIDNSFGSDGIVFSLNGLAGGPFQSTFSNVQFQARGLSSAINGSGLANGLPFSRFVPSFFAAFGNGGTNERVYGSLILTDAGSVPEPAAWLMLIIGFGLVGGARRWSSHKTAS